MAMRYYVDKRTIAALTAEQSASYAHGLPSTPDTVDIRFVASKASNSNFFGCCALVGAANITIQNAGSTTTPAMEIVAMCLHSMIQ